MGTLPRLSLLQRKFAPSLCDVGARGTKTILTLHESCTNSCFPPAVVLDTGQRTVDGGIADTPPAFWCPYSSGPAPSLLHSEPSFEKQPRVPVLCRGISATNPKDSGILMYLAASLDLDLALDPSSSECGPNERSFPARFNPPCWQLGPEKLTVQLYWHYRDTPGGQRVSELTLTIWAVEAMPTAGRCLEGSSFRLRARSAVSFLASGQSPPTQPHAFHQDQAP